MTSKPTPPKPDDGPTPAATDSGSPTWDPRQVMRDRAAATRRRRDDAITDLRLDMSAEQVLEEFGIDLDEIER